MPTYGTVPVTVPGVPAAWATLSKRFGKLSLLESLKPAIRYAEEGYPLTPILGKYWKRAYTKFKEEFTDEAFEGWFETFAPGGRHQKSVNYGVQKGTPKPFKQLGSQKAAPFMRVN